MKKYLLPVLAMLLFVTGCFSQSAENKNNLSFSAGGAFPIGNFSGTNPQSNNSGYAITGENTSVSFEHKLNKPFGLIALLYGMRNGINRKAISHEFEQNSFYGGSEFTDWNIKRSAFYTQSFLAGATGSFAIGTTNKFSLTTKAAMGVARVSSPKINASSHTDTSLVIISRNSVTGYGFSFLAGAELGYRLTNKIQVLLGADYFGTSSLTFKNVTNSVLIARGFAIPGLYTPSNALSYYENTRAQNQHQAFSMINLHAGIGLSL